MIIVTLTPFDINRESVKDRLVVRYRTCDNGQWRNNGFWLFALPVHVSEIVDRAHLELEAIQVYWQHSTLIVPDDDWTFTENL